MTWVKAQARPNHRAQAAGRVTQKELGLDAGRAEGDGGTGRIFPRPPSVRSGRESHTASRLLRQPVQQPSAVGCGEVRSPHARFVDPVDPPGGVARIQGHPEVQGVAKRSVTWACSPCMQVSRPGWVKVVAEQNCQPCRGHLPGGRRISAGRGGFAQGRVGDEGRFRGGRVCVLRTSGPPESEKGPPTLKTGQGCTPRPMPVHYRLRARPTPGSKAQPFPTRPVRAGSAMVSVGRGTRLGWDASSGSHRSRWWEGTRWTLASSLWGMDSKARAKCFPAPGYAPRTATELAIDSPDRDF